MSAPESPDVFPRPTGRGAGVRRLNRRPLGIIFGVLVVVCCVVLYTLAERTDNVSTSAAPKKPDPATSAGIFDSAPEAGLIRAATPPPASVSSGDATTPTDAAVVPGAAPAAVADLYAHEWQQYRQQQSQVRQAQMQAAMSALSSTPSITDFQKDVATGRGQGSSGGSSSASAELAGIGDQLQRVVSQARSASGAASPVGDENNAAGKRAWLDSEAPPSSYLAATRVAPLSPLEIKTGTVIPGVMIGGINSDLPGQIIAQVRENVYDTRTGGALLIPQGARLIGTYDSQVTRGQSRVLVAWTRIVFPDTSTLELGSMPGADVGGYAGLHDKVNNHYWRVFGDAMMLSLFAAGLQLSQPDSSSTTGAYDSQQVMAAALGQQLGQAGMQLVQKNSNIQPTLEIRPGLRFNVMVTRDIILPVWSGS